MEHVCMPCNYSSHYKHHIDKHNKTHKHKINMMKYKNTTKNQPIETQDDKHFQCMYCPALFLSQSGMFRHQNKCKNDEITLLKQQLQSQQEHFKKIETDARIKYLEEAIKNKDQIIESTIKHKDQIIGSTIKNKNEIIEILKTQSTTTNAIAAKTVSALTYLATKHKNAPPLLQVEYEEAKKLLKCDSDDSLIENILTEYREDRLDKFIGDIIVRHYKKEDPNQQSIWNSDATRLSFLIKDIIGEKSKWIKDNEGIKLRQLVIKPITALIEDLIKDWNEKQAKIGNHHMTGEQLDKNLRDQASALGILAKIKSCAFEEPIAIHVCPRVGLNRI